MKTRLEVRNGHLIGMTQEEVRADVLSNMIIYVEAKNSFDNNKDYPLSGLEYTDSFREDIVAFILGNDIKDWTPIPDYFILDDIERQNFIHYIKWDSNDGITTIS